MTDTFAHAAFRERRAREVRRRRAVLLHAAVWAAVNVMLAAVWALSGGGHPWFLYPLLGWGIGLVAHGASAYLMADPDDLVLAEERRRSDAQGQGRVARPS